MSGDDGRHRLGLIAITALSLFGALFARLWFLQIVEGDDLQAAASRNATRVVVIPAPRGRILDRNGIVLVDDRESIVVGIDYQEYSGLDPKEQARLRKKLATALSFRADPADVVTAKFIEGRLNDTRFSKFRPVPVASDVTQEMEIHLREQAAEFPSVKVERQTVRTYPYGSLAAHLLGYVGPLTDGQWERLKDHNDRDKPYVQTDEIGKSGVESTYEAYLRGTPGKRVYEVDRQNRLVGEIVSSRVEPRRGNDLYLSIDARVQGEAEHALRSGLNARRNTAGTLGYLPAEGGATAIIDPSNGQVAAMASYPTYNPADLVGGISCPEWRDLQGLPAEGSCKNIQKEIDAMPTEARPISKLLNRALAGTYPPGSTFKLATAFASMKLGLLTPNTSMYDPGYYLIPGCKGDRCKVSSPSAESGGIGTVNLAQAMTASSDTYFYKLGNDSWAAYKQDGRVGPDALQQEIAKLGFGTRTGIDLPSESAGRLPDPKWLKGFDEALNGKETEAGTWRSGNSINLAIGQGDMLATPLQLANAYAAFANNGTLYQPSVIDKITEYDQPAKVVRTYKPKVLHTVDWGVENHAALLDGLEGVTQDRPHATAKVAFEGFPQDVWLAAGKTGTAQSGTRENPEPDHSWFVGFGPNPDVRFVAAMIMEHSGFGGEASAPAVRQIFEAIATNSLYQIDLASLADPNKRGTRSTTATDDTTTSTTQGDGDATTTDSDPNDDGTMTPVPGSGG